MMSTASNVKQRPLEEIYQKKTQLEHILLRPDTYIGSVEKTSQSLWVLEETNKMTLKTVNIIPGLYKIFDEILVNAADNKIRDNRMDTIRVDIDPNTSRISVYNNGEGIPIEVHATEKVYIPELIFGHLLTSSNYNDDERKVTGGRNGYGAKLANIFSKEFIIETADGHSKYYQRFTNNMSAIGDPEITPLGVGNKVCGKDGREFTKISFIPDLSKFKRNEYSLDEDHLSLFYRRVYDLAGTIKGISVYLNGQKIQINSFSAYAQLYVDSICSAKHSVSTHKNQFINTQSHDIFGGQNKDGSELENDTEKKKKNSIFYLNVNDRWDIVVAPSEGQFQQVSFVNSIHTSKGGTHVNLVTDQLITAITEAISKKIKNVSAKPYQVKSHLWVFVNALIENPTFDSQTKETLTLRPSAFGSECILPASFLTKIISNSGIVLTLQTELLAAAKAKEDKELRKTDGHKSGRPSGIPKLDDANMAGTRQASKCTLILTEGDSAKALAVSGLSIVGRDYFGIYPLRGKLLNVRDANSKQISENVEISAVKQILGLQHGKIYTSRDSLRYGRIMLMTDQDHDGSHIKGLIINLIDYFWPSLLKIPSGFLTAFITPIVVATPKSRSLTIGSRNAANRDIGKGARIDSVTGAISFYTIPEYENWKNLQSPQSLSSYTIKYYKGLGTSTGTDAKKYFAAMDLHAKPFVSIEDHERSLIEMAFSKKKADARKDWLRDFIPGTFLDCSTPQFTIEDFIQKELILFSMADNVRSIPSVIDGLKPGLRKILFACFKRRLVKQEIKVAQLAGYVSEHAAYHHGEASLCASIVGLAQDFIGSNNVSLLIPSGQFGTRLQGGKDAASPRYIFTCLSEITRLLFMETDDFLLTYLNDDGQSIEPEWYMPIIPMVLVNGSEGIGTGWSTFIPPFSPIEIIDNLLRKISKNDTIPMIPMHPWYRNFTGSVVPILNSNVVTNQLSHHGELVDQSVYGYKIYGRAELKKELHDWYLHVTELPIGTWTQTYKEFLESLNLKSPQVVANFTEHHTDTSVSFTIRLGEGAYDVATASMADEHSESRSLILVPPKNAASESFLKLFKLVSSISLTNMVAFDSKGHLKRYSSPLEILEDWYTVRLDGYGRRKEYLISSLTAGWKRLDAKARFILEVLEEKIIIARRSKSDLILDLQSKGYDEEENGGFDYLLGMPLWSLTAEKITQLENERTSKQVELQALLAKSPSDLWKDDLIVLKKILSDPEYSSGAGVTCNIANTFASCHQDGFDLDIQVNASKNGRKFTPKIKEEPDMKNGKKLSTKSKKEITSSVPMENLPILPLPLPYSTDISINNPKAKIAATKRSKLDNVKSNKPGVKKINNEKNSTELSSSLPNNQTKIQFSKDTESLLDRIQSMLSINTPSVNTSGESKIKISSPGTTKRKTPLKNTIKKTAIPLIIEEDALSPITTASKRKYIRNGKTSFKTPIIEDDESTASTNGLVSDSDEAGLFSEDSLFSADDT